MTTALVIPAVIASSGRPINVMVRALAPISEVLVSRTVADLMASSSIQFRDRGAQALKGIPGDRQLYAVDT
jgi:class 3 adenylate cyclase